MEKAKENAFGPHAYSKEPSLFSLLVGIIFTISTNNDWACRSAEFTTEPHRLSPTPPNHAVKNVLAVLDNIAMR